MFLWSFSLRRFDERIMLGNNMGCLSFFYYFSGFGFAFVYGGSNFSSCGFNARLIFFAARKVTHKKLMSSKKGIIN